MIELNDLSLARGSDILIRNANARIHDGQRVGLVGRNGSGKSTLLALLRGELDPEQGDCLMPGGWRIASVRQETPALSTSALDYVLSGHSEYTAAQKAITEAEASGDGMAIAHAHELMAACHGYQQPARAGELLSGLGFTPDTHNHPVSAFSGGWRMRLNLAQALIAPADLLLLDEPTNHLDLDAIIWLQDFLKTHPATQIIIAHDRDFLDSLCQHILHIENNTIYSYRGNYSDFERQRHEHRMQAEATYRAEEAKRAHLQSFVDRFRAKASKAKQAQSRLKALEKLDAAPPPPPESSYELRFPVAERLPNPLMNLSKASAGYNGKPVVSGIKLNIGDEARIGLLGRNGAGKSTVMKLLAGVLDPLEGERNIHRDTRIGYFTQHSLDALDAEADALTHMQRLLPEQSDQESRTFLGFYGFRGDDVFAPVGRFSGGEKARLALALVIAKRPNLLLLDEPTNHLDLAMRDALTLGLQSYQGAMLIISHDRSLLRAACDEFRLVKDGRLSIFDGSLDDYRDLLLSDKKSANDNDGGNDGGEPSRQVQKRNEAELRRLLKPYRDAMDKAEKQLDKLQSALDKVEEALADSDIYNEANKVKLQDLLAKQAQLTREHNAIEAEWLSAAETLEEKQAELS
ncbi:ATP-binding cassette domain-containing protein [Cardiobacteriaceae bacterium TAE3-ERU3]|nr:ATP-binding cassette domain-containing protein [Cardiobacteriaceae bacterium TAE3-ERU3]